ncbi:hypothetical protein E2C01_061788 [Portunus trituberculatus]|uniref:Uncharacterized protein n=1 Tax=Portunus trituberculatus TaxID=210409 RepID=A0A5B7H4T3_PORTR|nr:hypothetical protein [Portunus trituberculatus]
MQCSASTKPVPLLPGTDRLSGCSASTARLPPPVATCPFALHRAGTKAPQDGFNFSIEGTVASGTCWHCALSA